MANTNLKLYTLWNNIEIYEEPVPVQLNPRPVRRMELYERVRTELCQNK